MLDLMALTTLFAFVCRIGWRRWGDIYVDFGQQLYVPWRLSEGAVLYRDIAYLHGPLSPYFNGVFFSFFGASYSTLVAVNLALILIASGTLYFTFLGTTGRLAAVAATSVFLSVFALGQYVGVGNYNWVSPYAHSTTHSLVFFAFLVPVLTARSDSAWKWGIAGILLGCLALTRAESAVAAILA